MQTADIKGDVFTEENSKISYGVKVDGTKNPVHIGRYSMILENSLVESTDDHPVHIGQGTVFGHRCKVIGASLGNFCEIGNGVQIAEGAKIGDFVIMGEGTIIPEGADIPSKSVVLGKPYKILRKLTEEDCAMIARMRPIELKLVDSESKKVKDQDPNDEVDRVIPFNEYLPEVGDMPSYGKRVEIIGQVKIGSGAKLADDVKIIGDSHGSVTIGDNVEIGKETVLHLLPGNHLVIKDNVSIGERCIVHGCHIENGVVIEDDAIICDLSELGKESRVKAGSLVPQRKIIKAAAVVEGYPVK